MSSRLTVDLAILAASLRRGACKRDWTLAACALAAVFALTAMGPTRAAPLSSRTDPQQALLTLPSQVAEPEMVDLPGGTFAMGNNDDPAEKPAHKVTVKPFS